MNFSRKEDVRYNIAFYKIFYFISQSRKLDQEKKATTEIEDSRVCSKIERTCVMEFVLIEKFRRVFSIRRKGWRRRGANATASTLDKLKNARDKLPIKLAFAPSSNATRTLLGLNSLNSVRNSPVFACIGRNFNLCQPLSHPPFER